MLLLSNYSGDIFIIRYLDKYCYILDLEFVTNCTKSLGYFYEKSLADK